MVMADINGLKGGTDKVVRISVMLSGCGKVVLTAYGSDLLLMIDKAAGRIKLRVSSAIAKTRHFDPRLSIRKEFVR